MIDLTINLGHVLTVVGFAGVGVGVIVAVRRDVAILSSRLNPLEAAVLRLTDVLEAVSRQDERLKAVERDLGRVYASKQHR